MEIRGNAGVTDSTESLIHSCATGTMVYIWNILEHLEPILVGIGQEAWYTLYESLDNIVRQIIFHVCHIMEIKHLNNRLDL